MSRSILNPLDRWKIRNEGLNFATERIVSWVRQAAGCNFFLLPKRLNCRAAKVVPGLCASMHFLIRRTEKEGSFLDASGELPLSARRLSMGDYKDIIGFIVQRDKSCIIE